MFSIEIYKLNQLENLNQQLWEYFSFESDNSIGEKIYQIANSIDIIRRFS